MHTKFRKMQTRSGKCRPSLGKCRPGLKQDFWECRPSLMLVIESYRKCWPDLIKSRPSLRKYRQKSENRPCRFEKVQTKYYISNRKCRPDLIKCRPGLKKCRPDLRKCRKRFMSVMESADQAWESTGPISSPLIMWEILKRFLS